MSHKGRQKADKYKCFCTFEKSVIFCNTVLNNKNNRIALGGVRWILNDISQKIGIENIHPHRFRRTLATDLLNKGMAIQDVSKILGHANIIITQTYYYHTEEKVENEFRKFI